ncbi:cell division control protein 6-like protein [Pyrus ussuriensis x Pyrus communis]|uniref:Cell division control protein 6-like protein n=1 Tax=Pyrus ussuriensis x Pyrus communis TaxID=2448454 RepID=A0A5N5FV89_9ROSA|nr:cell division control protein 6-like protein [Pyrus ussuriensis x Pyrus communis]
MPTIAKRSLELNEDIMAAQSESTLDAVPSAGGSPPPRRRLRSNSSPMKLSPISKPMKLGSPRKRLSTCVNTRANGIEKYFTQKKVQTLCKSVEKPKWNLKDSKQISEVKEALHVSTVPSTVSCREDELKRVLEFLKQCIYVCGCPGTGKSLSIEKVKQALVDWAGEAGFEEPDVLALNCSSLTKTSDIFAKILGKDQTPKEVKSKTSSLQLLQNLYSQKPLYSRRKMTLVIADELDFLITKDRVVLHDLFMLTTYQFSRCILIGVANAIDLAGRFLPRLQSLNCKPMVITFRAYSYDQILRILQQRLISLPYTVFQPPALELCARKVAAASGDMRKALCICRSAIEILEAEVKESAENLNSSSVVDAFFEQQTATAPAPVVKKQETDVVTIGHMASALSKTFKSPVVDTIQSLPQHQQIILCSAVRLFRGKKKDSTVAQLNKSYIDICKSTLIPPVGIFEFSSMCRVLNDQGLLKLGGQSRDEKLKRVTTNAADEADITFALQILLMLDTGGSHFPPASKFKYKVRNLTFYSSLEIHCLDYELCISYFELHESEPWRN